jgi:hypothetical protein
MRTEVSIEIKIGSSVLMTIDLDYRPWTADPDPWEVHKRPLGLLSTGNWLFNRPSQEARFSQDIRHMATGTTTHDVVLTLLRVPHLPGFNPFFRGQCGLAKAGPTSSIHTSIPAGGSVFWTVVKGPPPPV